MSNKIIQSLWIGDTASVVEQLCINSFLENGHEFHLYTYGDEVRNCPKGTVFKDANDVIPRESVYRDVLDTYTSFANWFRYKLLYERGGWWVDMDVICLKPFDFIPDYCFTTEVMFDDGKPQVIANNAIIKAPKHAEFLAEMLMFMSDKDLPKTRWGRFGSIFLDDILKLYDSKGFIQPPPIFCPINWHEINLFFEDKVDADFHESYAIHLWNNMWSKKGIDKNATYHSNSIIERLKSEYLPGSSFK